MQQQHLSFFMDLNSLSLPSLKWKSKFYLFSRESPPRSRVENIQFHVQLIDMAREVHFLFILRKKR